MQEKRKPSAVHPLSLNACAAAPMTPCDLMNKLINRCADMNRIQVLVEILLLCTDFPCWVNMQRRVCVKLSVNRPLV